jgi:hypothetical protein
MRFINLGLYGIFYFEKKFNSPIIKMKKVLLFVIIIFLSGTVSGQYLPEECPSDLRITYTATKGLMNSAETIYLSQDSCYYETIFQDVTNRFSFFLSGKNMKELYDVFMKYKIESITAKPLQRAAPERMGDNLLLQWDGFNSLLISNSGNFILEDKWLNNWKKILKNIRKFVKVEIDNRSRNFTVRLDESFSDKKLAMYLNNEFLYDNTISSVNVEGFTITLAAVPGQYYLKTVMTEIGISQEFKVDLLEGTELKLSLKGNTIEMNN